MGGAFTAWARGEPNSFYPDENCSEVQSIQGWNDCVCDLAKPVVCKEYRAAGASSGNGTVDPGEACDDGRESIRCDADCSLSACGDGLVNAARGELCDDAKTGQYCQTDCQGFVCPPGCSCLDVAARSYALCPSAATFRDAGVACGRAGMTLARIYGAGIRPGAPHAGHPERHRRLLDRGVRYRPAGCLGVE